eukprot:c2436_g1_i2.p1 GENE.c2436_g1_i2~~c2436_g1_i2.p1  ORF type:complete len:749 (-),score=255.67 c2436_g1_i2:60-2186(-)
MINGSVGFEALLPFLVAPMKPAKAAGKKAKAPPKVETDLVDSVVKQRMRQLVHKYLASAVLKQRKLQAIQETLEKLMTEQSKTEAMTQAKQAAIDKAVTLQKELRQALAQAQEDLAKETGRVDQTAAKAHALVEKKQAELATSRENLRLAHEALVEHQETLRAYQNELDAIRNETVLQEEREEHDLLMAELRAELEADMATYERQFEELRSDLEAKTEQEISQRIEAACAADIAEIERQEKELQQKLYAEALAIKAAREKLLLLRQQAENKELEIDAHVANYDRRVEEVVTPLRLEIEALRAEIFESQVYQDRKLELEEELQRLSDELEVVVQRISERNDEMREVQREFDDMLEKMKAEKLSKLDAAKEAYNEFEENDIKQELSQCLQEKSQIVQKLRANVEKAQSLVKGHASGSDDAKKAMKSTKEVDDKKLRQLNEELGVRSKQIDNLKKLVKNYRDEVTALEKIRTSVGRVSQGYNQYLENLRSQLAWLNTHLEHLQAPNVEFNSHSVLVPRLEYCAKATELSAKEVKNLAYAFGDRVTAAKWHASLLASRMTIMTKVVASTETDLGLAKQRLGLVQAEIANTEAEMLVERQRKQLLEQDIASHKERGALLQAATTNTQNEMRLHKIATSVWQGKIKVVRDEIKVRESRSRVLDEEVTRLDDTRKFKQETLTMLENLEKNYQAALDMSTEELDCIQTQHDVLVLR